MGEMEPRMLEVWVQATNLVLSERRGRRSEGSRCGFGEGFEGRHHLMVTSRRVASWTQAARLASWSRVERTISEPGVRWL